MATHRGGDVGIMGGLSKEQCSVEQNEWQPTCRCNDESACAPGTSGYSRLGASDELMCFWDEARHDENCVPGVPEICPRADAAVGGSGVRAAVKLRKDGQNRQTGE
jgi:hypothetical protein